MDKGKVIKEFEDFVKSFSKRNDTYYKALFVSVLSMMKEQEAKTHGAVCCKDCVYGEKCVEPYKDYWCNRFEKYFDGDWFCKDGTKRSDDDGQKEDI